METMMDIRGMIRPNILELEPYHCARETVQDGVLLDANENPYPTDWRGVRLNRYPDPYQRRLRRAIAQYLGVETGNVVAGSGSDEVLDWIFKVFCQPQRDRVAVAEPTYGMYRVTARIFDIPLFEFRLDETFDFRAEEFLNAVPEDTKVLFLCSPNNPTGNLLSGSEILKVCRQWAGLVVLDEAYIEFAAAASLVPEVQQTPNLLILRTLSKAFGRAGLRLGYAVANAEIVTHFLKVKAPYNLNALTQDQGCLAFDDAGWQEERVRRIREEREGLAGRLRRLAGVQRVYPSQANFLLFRCRQASRVCRELLQRGVVVRDRSALPGLDDCLRVSIGTPEENNLFLQELRSIL